MSDDTFYVGYRDRAPAGHARTMRLVVLALLVLAAALAAGFTSEQDPFNDGVFEFLNVQTFEGVLRTDPVPMLEVARPGSDVPASFLLVMLGKYGAGDLVAGRDGERVRVAGTLVYNGAVTMIEIAEQGIESAGGVSDAVQPGLVALGERALVGEIIDSKCWLGVMKPGRLKTHRSCAINCIAGGIPPLFVVSSGERHDAYVLIGRDGRTLNAEILDIVGENLTVTGEVSTMGDMLVLAAEPEDFAPYTP